MNTESVLARFERLPIAKALLADLSVDLGEELSLKLFPNPVTIKPGDTYKKYALRFSCIRDVRFSLSLSAAPIEVLTHTVRRSSPSPGTKEPSSNSDGNAGKTWWFSLRLSVGELEVEAEDFSLTLIQRLQVADRYIDHE